MSFHNNFKKLETWFFSFDSNTMIIHLILIPCYPARPLVTEIQSGTLTELTSHLKTITARLCDDSDDVSSTGDDVIKASVPRTLVATITDLKNECDVLRHTAAQLQV